MALDTDFSDMKKTVRNFWDTLYIVCKISSVPGRDFVQLLTNINIFGTKHGNLGGDSVQHGNCQRELLITSPHIKIVGSLKLKEGFPVNLHRI